jgi:hypothetical protein
MYTGDIVIHINEELDDNSIHDLEQQISDEPGILCACAHERTRHLMVVDYDPAEVRPSGIVQSFRDHGLHAQMVGF